MDIIWQQAEAMADEIIRLRRDLHKYPETGWTEFRTASIIITALKKLGYEVYFGADVLDAQSMMGLPAEEKLQACMQRAVNEGADADLVELMQGGKTAVMAVLRGSKPGKTVAFRFDMDCNDVDEAKNDKHRPYREGFASVHENAMHACGHDGHVAAGLAFAKLLKQYQTELAGKVKLIFQPAEEGVRGAYAMVKAGVIDDADYCFGGHLGFKATENDSLICSTGEFLATAKLDVTFYGRASHAGLLPEAGKNALLAAAQASISLNTIARHSKGASRINVGLLNAGTGRNIVPDKAELKLETRGADTEINNFMEQEAVRIIKACADMYDVKVRIVKAGSAPGGAADTGLGAEVAALAESKGAYQKIIPCTSMGGSEDYTYFLEQINKQGGRGLYMMYGTRLAAGHHNSYFDFDEQCLWKMAAFLTELALHYTHK